MIGGLSLEFYYRVGERYEMRRFNNPVAWFYEPKVGEAVMRDMLAGGRRHGALRSPVAGEDRGRRDGARITEITMTNGAKFRGRMFADCTYEGDLMAQAKVSYTWGRES